MNLLSVKEFVKCTEGVSYKNLKIKQDKYGQHFQNFFSIPFLPTNQI